MLEPPPPKKNFLFQLLKDILGRMVHEAVLNESKASLNSKAERMGYRVARLSVEITVKKAKDSVDLVDKTSKEEKSEMLALIERVVANRLQFKSNDQLSSRKRPDPVMSESENTDDKRSRASAASTSSENSEHVNFNFNDTYDVNWPSVSALVTSTQVANRSMPGEAEASCDSDLPSLASNSSSVVYLHKAID